MNAPLAERMRPQSLADYRGQPHLVGPEGIVSRFIKSGKLPSIIFWGPPGVGKTTLAKLLAKSLDRHFYHLSAIQSGVKEVREVIDSAKKTAAFDKTPPLLFIDEIHRFSKSQQDALLGAVEQGLVTLIGATTENPSFEVISPLLSRCQVYTLTPHSNEQLQSVLEKAISDDAMLSSRKINLVESDAILGFAGGDARKALNILEAVVDYFPIDPLEISNEKVKEVVKNNPVMYDKAGEQHYDVISAFIKSVRGSDPNAAVYWLAKMIEAGEDPKFIARRLVILASEDIGNANPNALLLATSTFQAIELIGMPEGRIVLSQCTIYLATSPKSNASYEAINSAQHLVKNESNQAVPLHLRNAPTQLMKNLDYGAGYKYPHGFKGNFTDQEYLPEGLKGSSLVKFGANPKEEELKKKMTALWGDKYDFNS
ncbi:MAG: replication-associated recombination protein A [Luteibaculum sp.]